MRQGTDLTSGPIYATLLAFALPTLGSSVLQSANGSIDAVWVGRLLGENALAATTNGNLIMFLLTAFVFGFGMASTILIGQAVGRRDIGAAREVVGTAVGTFAPLAILISVAGWFLAPQVLALLGTGPEITPLARDFLRVTFFAMPAILLQTMLMMALRGTGDAVTPLIFMGLAVILDVVLNPVFILGMGPAPRMGIGGSAFAMAVANYVSLIAMVGYLYLRRNPLRLAGPDLRLLIPATPVLRLMLSKGLPMGLQMVVVSSAMLTMISLVNREGVDTTAAFGATQQLWTYVQMPAMAIGAAVSSMAAQNVGAGKWDRVDQIARSGVLCGLAITGSAAVIIYLLGDVTLRIFLPGDSPALPIAHHINERVLWGFVLFSVTFALSGVVRATGAVWTPLLILIVSMYVVRVPFASLMSERIGADAIWWSFPLGIVASGVLTTLYYRFGGWRKLRLLSPRAAGQAPDAGMATPAVSVADTARPARA